MDCKSTHTPTPRKSAKAILKIQLPQEPTGENNVNVKIIDGIFFFFFFLKIIWNVLIVRLMLEENFD